MYKPVIANRERETRNILGGSLRAAQSGKDFILSGRAASFNTLSTDLGGFREMLLPGCFSDSLRSGADVKALVNHDASKLLGRVKNGTLTLQEVSGGLDFSVRLNPESQAHRDLYASIERGDMDACSFAFVVASPAADESWEEDVDERGVRFMKRSLRKVSLMDVSCVTSPAYPQGTMVSARAANMTAKETGIHYVLPLPTHSELLARAEKIGKQIQEDRAREAPEAERFAREQRENEERIRQSMRLYRPDKW